MSSEKGVTIKTLEEMLKPSKHGVTLTGRYNADRAKAVLSNLCSIIPIMVQNRATKVDGLKSMLEWQSRYGKKSGSKIQYKTSSAYGRLYPKDARHGYVGITRQARHYLAYDLYTDIDIDNCHPVFIEQLFPVITGHTSEALHDWNTRRNQLFNELIELSSNCGGSIGKDDCKTIAYTFLYGGDMAFRFKELSLPTDIAPGSLYQRCKRLCSDMEEFTKCFKNRFPDVWSAISGSDNNKDASTLSIIMQHIERHVALILKDVAEKRNFEVGDICHDGLLIGRSGFPVSKSECEEYFKDAVEVIKALTGFEIKLSVKEMKEPEWSSLLFTPSSSEPTNDLEAAKTLYSLHPYWVTCKGSLLVFNDKDGMWSADRLVHGSIASKFVKELGKYATMTKHTTAMFSKLKEYNIDDKWLDRMETSYIGKFIFKDGWYDFDTATFHKEFSPSIYFPFPAVMNFPRENLLTDEVYKTLFLDPLGDDIGKYQLQLLSLAVAGKKSKNINFCIGPNGNNGKSLEALAVGASLGEYFGSFSAECLAHGSKDEDARIWRWAMLLRYCLVVMSQEADPNTVFDGTLIKKISGGDKLVARLHSGNETSFIPHFTPFIFANEIDKITPHDQALDKRLRAIPFMVQFVDNPDPNDPLQKKMDQDLSLKVQTEKFASALFRLYINTYEDIRVNGMPVPPQVVTEAKATYVSEMVNHVDRFLEQFEITNNPDDFITNESIKGFLKSLDTGKSDRNFTAMLLDYCAKHNFHGVAKDRKHTGRGLSGIRAIPMDADPLTFRTFGG